MIEAFTTKDQDSTKFMIGYTIVDNKATKFIKPLEFYKTIIIRDNDDVKNIEQNDWLEGNIEADKKNSLIIALSKDENEFIELTKSFGLSFNDRPFESQFNGSIFKFISQKQIRDILFNENIEKNIYEKYAFKRHILLMGEKGSGKTYEAYDFISKSGYKHVFIGGNADMDATDLKGMLVPYSNGNDRSFIWVDGPLTEAFRLAQSEKVVLLVDEFLRISPNGQSLFIPTLTPNNNGQYVLNTGRIIDVENGVGKTETLVIPCENLFAIGTTNIGIDYDIGSADEALLDRFILIDKQTTLKGLTNILNQTAKKVDWLKNDDEKNIMVKRLTGFFEAYKNVSDNVDLKIINVRHLCNSLEDSCAEIDLKKSLIDRIPTWAKRDINGLLNNEHVEVLEKLIDKHF